MPTYRFTPSESNDAKGTNGKIISGYLTQSILAVQRKISIAFEASVIAGKGSKKVMRPLLSTLKPLSFFVREHLVIFTE